ncbi:MAG: DNA cytosine methyltransferase [Candidatus Omnitrophica bacterium]|nr:DNA cytosine methyltransferase [Candidatus Omnitrophota bacterium]
MSVKSAYSVVSLFSGCGGLDLGFRGGFKSLGKNYSKLNYNLEWANDFNPEACLTFQKYFGDHIVHGDITEILKGIKKNSLLDKPLPAKADIVLGGFPCQDFSHAGKRLGFTSKRGVLYLSMIEVIKKTKPYVFVAENVRGLLTIDNGEAIKTIIRDFEALGYNVVPNLYLAANYGVPQSRERVILVGTRKDVLPPFEHPQPILNKNTWISVEKAIADLVDAKEGSISNHYWSKAKKNNGQGNNKIDKDRPGPTMRAEHHGNIEWLWNGQRRLSAREAARIQSFPDDFIFHPSTSSAYKQIGNAVPPVLGWHVAKAIQAFLDKNLQKELEYDLCSC